MSDECNACLQDQGCCFCSDIIGQFKELNRYLRALGLLEFIASPSVASVVYTQVLYIN